MIKFVMTLALGRSCLQTSVACLAMLDTSLGSSLPVMALMTVPRTVWNGCSVSIE